MENNSLKKTANLPKNKESGFLSSTKSSLLAFDCAFLKHNIAGVDEAGRGPLAGPLVAAAVILDFNKNYAYINDSKKMNPKQRRIAYEDILSNAVACNWAILDSQAVDELNPLKAALKAMSLALAGLSVTPELVLVDGNQLPQSNLACQAVVKGDSLSLSIAAASIVAKVVRDDLMMIEHGKYPNYGFDRHKGYGTALHKDAIKKYGPCPCHRRTFHGVKEFFIDYE